MLNKKNRTTARGNIIRVQQYKGFVGIVFLALSLISIVAATIAYMGRENSSATSNESAKSKASILIHQAEEYKKSWDIMVVDAPNGEVFLLGSGFGRYDTPGVSYMTNQIPPAGSIISGAPAVSGKWNAFPSATLPGVGSRWGTELVMSVSGLTLEICRGINHILYNDSLTSNPAQSTATADRWWTGGPGYIMDQDVTEYNYLGRPTGCVKSSDGFYVFYKTLGER